MKGTRGENHPKCKLTERQVRLIKANRVSKYKELAEKYEVSIRTIGSIKAGNSWGYLK